ncbi:MAG: fucose isomerase [Candidatus Abyssubacteria bacterium]
MTNNLSNIPVVSLGVVGVSRDCFPISLTERRLTALMDQLSKAGIKAHRCSVIIESEVHAASACKELQAAGCNAAVVYLGNFGPEGPTTQFIQRFPGPVMVCAAAEESKAVLARDRGDALCGLLNCSYNLGLRKLRVFIPESPVGLADQLAECVASFDRIARVAVGMKNLKIFSFGPRPQDFLACNAPIQPLFDLGIEVMENSELDLFRIYKEAASKKKKLKAVAADMEKELGPGNIYPELIPRLAQFETALLDFMEENLGARTYGVFANKCWPAFEHEFGFVPCYVNSRLAARGIPVACEVDIYGALSEYMVQLAGLTPVTLLDINNSVPSEILPNNQDLRGAQARDLFMGFHCGNTCSTCMKDCSMSYQLIMNRLIEDGGTPDITRGTLEGQLRPGPVTLFRLQSTPDCVLRSYVAEGEILDIDPCTFGSVGVIAVPGFARFYRHVLIGKRFPHHVAVGFEKAGHALFEALKLLGVADINAPLPEKVPYPGENPFD